MSDRDGGSSAWRRRQRRLRSVLRHERQTVAMELAAALHPSRDEGRVKFDRPAGTRDRQPRTEPEPQGRAVTVGYVAAPAPLLAVPLLAGAASEAIHGAALSFLLQSLAVKEEGGRGAGQKVRESLERLRAKVDVEHAALRGSLFVFRREEEEEEEEREKVTS